MKKLGIPTITLCYILFTLLVFSFLLVVNMNTPLIGEDYGLSPVNISTPRLSSLQRVSRIFSRVVTQFTQWNSRLGEQLAIVFLGFNKTFFNILNSIITTMFMFLIFSYSFGRRINTKSIDDLYALIFIFSLYLCFMPRLGEITFWLAGASNYLWGVIILLLFFLPYRLVIYTSEIRKLKVLPTLIFTLFGFVAGMTNENTVPVFLLLICLMYFGFRKKNVRLPVWFYSGAGALAIGYMTLILSPSTQRRINFYNELFNITDVTFVDYILRMQNVINAFIHSSAFFLIIFFAVLGIYLLIRWVSINKGTYTIAAEGMRESANNLTVVLTILALSLVSCLILIGNSYFEYRAFLLMNIMIIVATTTLFFSRVIWRSFLKITRGVVTVLLIFALWNMRIIYQDYSSFYQEAKARHEYILDLKSHGQNSIEVSGFRIEDSRVLTTREIWLMTSGQYSLYYGVDEISIVP